MSADDIINQVIDDAYEWLEMSDDPATMVAGILANKIVKLNEYIKFLEGRVKYATANK